jgi:gamma-glutamylcyclotransferase (GGCT)/AIG2-like uncharacterized protein YtfP
MRPLLYRVIVYGTLLVGEGNHFVAAPYIRDIQTGKVKGRLYDVGACPILVVEEEGEVIGEWLTVMEEGLQAMDELEGHVEGGQHNEYERVWVKDLQQPLEGYVYPKSKAARLPLIPSGPWRHRHLH